jgi:hypothetical protein
VERYADLNRDSAVTRYEISEGSIVVEFDNGRRYLYDFSKPGPIDVETMKRLASSGRGLGSFISKRVKRRYARRLL